MNKLEAILALMREAQAEGGTKIGYRIANKACRALGLTNGETQTILQRLEFHDEKGNPYPWLLKKAKP